MNSPLFHPSSSLLPHLCMSAVSHQLWQLTVASTFPWHEPTWSGKQLTTQWESDVPTTAAWVVSAADLDAASAFVFFHSINVVGWHQTSCTLPHQSVAKLFHKFASLQKHKIQHECVCVFILRLNGCNHYIRIIKKTHMWIHLNNNINQNPMFHMFPSVCLLVELLYYLPDISTTFFYKSTMWTEFPDVVEICSFSEGNLFSLCLSLFSRITCCLVLPNTFFYRLKRKSY